MRATLLLISGVVLYAFVRDILPRLFIARVQYIYNLETKKASVPKD
ncbi:membrane protein [Microbacterium phage Zooman]|nr:membrane protein [Microbacterium phage Zooman]